MLHVHKTETGGVYHGRGGCHVHVHVHHGDHDRLDVFHTQVAHRHSAQHKSLFQANLLISKHSLLMWREYIISANRRVC